MKNTKRCITGLAIAAALFLAAQAGHAQTGYWPNSQPYACTYALSNGSTGVALVTITLGPIKYARSGTVTNLYPNGSTLVKQVTIATDLNGGTEFGYRAEDPNSTNPPVTCLLNTYEYGRHLVFSDCNNGTRQDCRQWW